MTVLTGGRVRLRRLRADDRSWLLELEQDADGGLAARAGPAEPWSGADLDAYLARHADSLLYAIETIDGSPVGKCVLKHHDAKNRHAAIGISILSSAQGQGYGTEAIALLVEHGFRQYDLHKVKLDVRASNASAIAVYEKLGFQVDVRRREARYRDGAVHDVLDMSLRQGVWEAVREELVG